MELYVGIRIVVPEPEEDDTWENGMITDVDDITDEGTVIFSDDEYDEHEIDQTRIQVYNG